MVRIGNWKYKRDFGSGVKPDFNFNRADFARRLDKLERCSDSERKAKLLETKKVLSRYFSVASRRKHRIHWNNRTDRLKPLSQMYNELGVGYLNNKDITRAQVLHLMVWIHNVTDMLRVVKYKIFQIFWKNVKAYSDGTIDAEHQVKKLNVELKWFVRKRPFMRHFKDGHWMDQLDTPVLYEDECVFDVRPGKRQFKKAGRLRSSFKKVNGRFKRTFGEDKNNRRWVRLDQYNNYKYDKRM